MGFHSGDSEGPLGVIRNLKLEVKPPWRDLQLSEGSLRGSDKCLQSACLAFSGGFYCVAHMGDGSHSRAS